MGATFRTSYLHNTLWRRLRRRHLLDGLWIFRVGTSLLIPVCVVGWMWRDQGWGWLAQIARWAWFLLTGMSFAGAILALVFWPFRGDVVRGPARWTFLLSAFAWGSTSVALLIGRIEWAIVLSFSMGIFSHFVNKAGLFSWRNLPLALLDIALVSAFLANSIAWVVAAYLLSRIIQPLLKPGLRDIIVQKPTEADYIARLQKQCAAGHG